MAFPPLTHRDMGNVLKASVTLKTMEVRVLAASHRTFSK
ncbi:protein of unknown function [Shewanella benthica]|uniref:Uncharacterized protein n=1 Tax=Shewanella benthica TaxID=43661 RepID=A0A330LWZ1_9GAMM|nr:protein of unknown function [Shewanella benthica]